MTGNAAWLIVCRVAADALNLLLFVLISRTFGPEGTGMYAYGFAIAGFLFAATTLGVEEYAVREYTRADGAQRTRLLRDVLGTQLCMVCLALLGLALFIGATQPDPATLLCIVALTAYQLGNAVAATLFVPAMAEQHMMEQALSFLASRSLAFVLAGALILSGAADLPRSLVAFATSGVLILALAARSARAHGQPLGIHVSMTALKRRLGELWSFASIDLLGQVLARIGVIALTLQVSSTAAGIFATGLKLIEAATLPLYFIGAAAYPRLCETFHGAPHDFRRLEQRLLWLSLAASLSIAAGMYFIVPWLLVPVFGHQYDGTQADIGNMALLAFVLAAEIIPGRILLAADRQVERAAIVAGGALVCVAVNFAFVPRWHQHAANFGTAAAYAAVCACYARLLLRRTHSQRTPQALRELS